MKILAIDIGGTKIKVLATNQTEPRRLETGKEFTPAKLVEAVSQLAEGWEYDRISIGYPGVVGDHGPRAEPGNLGSGWVGFDYAAAFGLPVKICNDAAMQALGSYEGGRMLFLGLGTGLGSAFIAERVLVTLELGRLRVGDRKKTLGEQLGRAGREKLGRDAWAELAREVAGDLKGAFLADDVVFGGGNARDLGELPPGMRLGHNLTAFRGGFRLWSIEDAPVHTADQSHELNSPETREEWRLL